MLDNELTQGLIGAGDNLFLDPNTGEFKTVQQGTQGTDTQWMWGDDGLVPLDGANQAGVLTPFMEIAEQYRGGTPIEGATWQDAARKSLEGFMRAEYGAQPYGMNYETLDPIFNWDPERSGMEGSQFRMGTLQELSSTLPDFFNTGNLVRDTMGNWVSTGLPGEFDPLLGLNASDKLLAFEDVPFEDVEKIIGNLPGQLLDLGSTHALRGQISDLEQQLEHWARVNRESVASGNNDLAGHSTQTYQNLQRQHQQLVSQLNQQSFVSLDDARTQLKDFNDFIFKLNLDRYQTPDEIIKATPESVLQKFFDLPAYRLMFGNEEGALDPYASPTERFRADPGYQWTQDEGMRNIQRNAAAKGLLESGSTMRDLQDYGQNLADQNYQRYQGQNQALFSDWQNQLTGIANQGAAFSNPQIPLGVGNQLAGGTLGTAGQGAGVLGAAGSNISNLFANQGVFGGNAFLNTGAAQANTAMQAASLAAQLQSAQQAGGGGGGGGGGFGQALQGIGSLLGGFM